MIVIGLIAIIVGRRASANLANLRGSLSDESFLWAEFNRHDKEGYGYLNPDQFAHFIWELGIEFDDVYTLKAFNTIDTNHQGKITFYQFQKWWQQCNFEGSDDGTSYRAMV